MICWSVTQRGKHPRLAAGCVTHRRPGPRAPRRLCKRRQLPQPRLPVVGARPPSKAHRLGAWAGHWGNGAVCWPSLENSSGTVAMPWAPSLGGGTVLPWPDPAEEGVSGQGICRVGAGKVTRAGKGCVWETLRKSLARGRIGDFFSFTTKFWFLTIWIAAFRGAGTRTATPG